MHTLLSLALGLNLGNAVITVTQGDYSPRALVSAIFSVVLVVLWGAYQSAEMRRNVK